MCLGRLTVAERKATNLKPPIDLGGESTRNKKPNLFGLLVGVDGGYALPIFFAQTAKARSFSV